MFAEKYISRGECQSPALARPETLSWWCDDQSLMLSVMSESLLGQEGSLWPVGPHRVAPRREGMYLEWF